MLRIDPHTHTSLSDGTDTPAQLMAVAARVGLDVIGLTDHDTTAGWAEAAANVENTGVALIRGVEMSCSSQGITVHLLGYLFDPTHPSLVAMWNKTKQDRIRRAEELVSRVAQDYPITYEDVLVHAGQSHTIGRPHIADALVAAGCFADRNGAFEHVLHPRGPYYVRYQAPDPVEAVQVIREAGGVPVLAHPRASARQRLLPEDVIAEMAQAGLFGIERDHREHDEAARADVDRIAYRHGLALTGASDYHGSGKPNVLGENLTPEHVYRAIEEQGHLEVVRP